MERRIGGRLVTGIAPLENNIRFIRPDILPCARSAVARGHATPSSNRRIAGVWRTDQVKVRVRTNTERIPRLARILHLVVKIRLGIPEPVGLLDITRAEAKQSADLAIIVPATGKGVEFGRPRSRLRLVGAFHGGGETPDPPPAGCVGFRRGDTLSGVIAGEFLVVSALRGWRHNLDAFDMNRCLDRPRIAQRKRKISEEAQSGHLRAVVIIIGCAPSRLDRQVVGFWD